MPFYVEKYKNHEMIIEALSGNKYTTKAGILMAQMSICDNLDFQIVTEEPDAFIVPAVYTYRNDDGDIEECYGFYSVPSEYAEQIAQSAVEGEDHWNNIQVTNCIKAIKAIEKEKEAQKRLYEESASIDIENRYFANIKAGDEVACSPVWGNNGFVQYATLTRECAGVWYGIPYGAESADEQEITVICPY